MFGNPDLIYTKAGVWESVVISDYTFASFGPFRARSKGKRKFEFYEDIHAHIHRGYDMSVLFGNTLGSGMAAQSAITNKMASFLTAVHNVNVSPVRVMSFNKVTNSELLTKVALRPEVNLVQAGQAYNAAINNMLKTITKKKPVPPILRSLLKKNRHRFKGAGQDYTSVWAAPYISIFDVKSLGAGYDGK